MMQNVISLEYRRYYSAFLVLLTLILLLLPNHVFSREKAWPGELISVGSHRLHIHCVGQGSPSVIIDSGIGGFSLEWSKVQQLLANEVRICSYDRAGYGWSDPGPRPRTTARIASELRRLLQNARIPGPYILVGHSFGGYNTRYFASTFPGLTAGLVLVDSSHHEQFNTEEFKRIQVKPAKENPRFRNGITLRLVHPVIAEGYPEHSKRLAYMLMSTVKAKSTLMNELDFMPVSAEQVSEQTNHPPYKFPVVILTRGKRVWPHDDVGERRELQWLRLQSDLENISLQSQHYMAKESGHIIHLDQPEFVAMNISATVQNVRALAHEQALSRKFDIRLPEHASITTFQPFSDSFHYDEDASNKNSILNKSVHQVMFDNKLRHFGNHSTYFMR